MFKNNHILIKKKLIVTKKLKVKTWWGYLYCFIIIFLINLVPKYWFFWHQLAQMQIQNHIDSGYSMHENYRQHNYPICVRMQKH